MIHSVEYASDDDDDAMSTEDETEDEMYKTDDDGDEGDEGDVGDEGDAALLLHVDESHEHDISVIVHVDEDDEGAVRATARNVERLPPIIVNRPPGPSLADAGLY